MSLFDGSIKKISIGESFPLFDHERLLFFGPKNNKK